MISVLLFYLFGLISSERMLRFISRISSGKYWLRVIASVVFVFSALFAHADNYLLGNIIPISQIINQKGAVEIKGNFIKPVTSNAVTLTVFYKGSSGVWTPAWCKVFAAGSVYDEPLKAVFELPVTSTGSYQIKTELSSATTLSNWGDMSWQNEYRHYKQGDYTVGLCDLDENEYTMLFTPKKANTLLYTNGVLSGIKDRVNSGNLIRKLDNIKLSINGSGVLNTATNGTAYVSLTNPNNVSEIVSAQKYIYQNSSFSPFEYSYHDPVYLFAGKFPGTGFFITFSYWFLPPEQNGEESGRGYLDFTNPNSLINRYYNLYNYIQEHLSDVIANQEPVVIAISKSTGLRVYKSNGTYVALNAVSNYNGINTYGYPKLYDKFRGPGSETFSLKGVSAATLYGVGAIRNHIVGGTPRPLAELETEIKKFINYVGIFDASGAYNITGQCANTCVSIIPGRTADYIPVDWTLAPNSYIFTGKDASGNNVDGLYIPVKKAYAMWAGGGAFMKNASGNYTPIPAGTASAGIYWQDEPGLIKEVSLVGTGDAARIKVMVNKQKEGNAVISYRVNDTVYWTWHVWVTDDPRINGSTYRHGFEKDRNGIAVSDWKWMDRNLGATNASFTGNDWHKSGGLLYQWGRKDPFPPLVYKDGTFYEINGEVGSIRHTSASYSRTYDAAKPSAVLPIKYRGNLYANKSTGSDLSNDNIRYSIKNPITYILTPTYVFKKGDVKNNNGESYFQQTIVGTDTSWLRRDLTTWFSKNKYKYYNAAKPDSNIAWDLWADINGGKATNINSANATLAAISSRYAMKSPYDPCPCNWRVPSYYATSASTRKASPWGQDSDSLGDYTTFYPDTLSNRYEGVKIYPGRGFDFTKTTNSNIGLLPINGNYELYPNTVTLKSSSTTGLIETSVVSQDHGADGGLQTSTFSSGQPGSEPMFGSQTLALICDPYNFKTRVGWYYVDMNAPYGSSVEASGVRCIKDPNNAYMPVDFATQFVAAASQAIPLDTLRKWCDDPNSYIADPAKQSRVIKIPLRKAYAMHKLYLTEDASMPTGTYKTPAVEWTTDTSLIKSIVINTGSSIAMDTLVVTLNSGKYGNAVVGFHCGNSGLWSNGRLIDPVIWSWHIWAPVVDPRLDTLSYTTETESTGAIPANQQFINPYRSKGVPAGVPLTTTFMNMDLGALNPAPATLDYNLIMNSGGLHYQWGRKDPIPVFLRPGGVGLPANTYGIFRQIGPATTGAAMYSTAMNEATYLQNFSKEYTNYSVAANITTSDNKAIRIRKILLYAAQHPLEYLFHNADASTNQYNQVKDWLSNENNLFMDRWGHANVKSPFDPCPLGWRIPDAAAAASKLDNAFERGTNPWFYNGYRVSPMTEDKYGLSTAWPMYIFDEAYSPSNMRYPGKVVMRYSPVARFVWAFNDPAYRIGNIPNNGIRGIISGNQLSLTSGAHVITGLWLAAGTGGYSGRAAHLRVDVNTGSGQIGKFAPGVATSPQAAMSCRCAKINYDAVTGKEIGRYDPDATIAVSPIALSKADNKLNAQDFDQMARENQISVFPNPVTDIVRIDAPDDRDYYYQIYDMTGKMVKEGKFKNKETDLSALNAGTYLIRINNAGSVVKFVKL